MSLDLSCARCPNSIEEAAALVFGPPDEGSKTIKTHLCRACYFELTGWILGYERQHCDICEEMGEPGICGAESCMPDDPGEWEEGLDDDVRVTVLNYEKNRGYHRNIVDVAVAAITDLEELEAIPAVPKKWSDLTPEEWAKLRSTADYLDTGDPDA